MHGTKTWPGFISWDAEEVVSRLSTFLYNQSISADLESYATLIVFNRRWVKVSQSRLMQWTGLSR